MGIIQTVLAILGIADAALPLVEAIFGPFMVYVATIAKQLFGDKAATELASLKDSAGGFVTAFEGDVKGAEDLINGLAPSVSALFALFPGLAQQLAAEYNTMKAGSSTGAPIPRSLATRVVQAAHSDMKVNTGA